MNINHLCYPCMDAHKRQCTPSLSYTKSHGACRVWNQARIQCGVRVCTKMREINAFGWTCWRPEWTLTDGKVCCKTARVCPAILPTSPWKQLCVLASHNGNFDVIRLVALTIVFLICPKKGMAKKTNHNEFAYDEKNSRIEPRNNNHPTTK